MAEDLCQHHFALEHINQSKVWKHFTRGDGNDIVLQALNSQKQCRVMVVRLVVFFDT